MTSPLPRWARRARREKFAIPAFNVSDLEMVEAIVRAAKQKRSPVIIQMSSSALAYAGDATLLQLIANVVRDLKPRAPIITHLDHGKELSLVKRCVNLGFNSVHMDASALPYEKNVAMTRRAVDYASKKNIPVQGELGAILGTEGLTKIRRGFDYSQMMTDPTKARDFVRRTGITTLAVSVGTIHGSFKGVEKIDFARLKKIARAVRVPLVLHGGSGNAPATLKRAIRSGISIINIDTDLRLAFVSGLRQSLKKVTRGKKVDPRQIMGQAALGMQKEAERFIMICGSNNKA